MVSIGTIVSKQFGNHQKWDFLVFTILTMFSLLNGQTTVFYLIYFFWWNELIRLLVDRFFLKRNPNAILANKQTSLVPSIIQMFVYLIFIVVFFAFIGGLGNQEITTINFEVIFFKNWFFNANLIFIFIERIYLHLRNQPLSVSFGAFTPNMIVLHISIILGVFVLFFIVDRFPKIFTPENLWGSVLVALPFLLIKMGMVYLTSPKK